MHGYEARTITKAKQKKTEAAVILETNIKVMKEAEQSNKTTCCLYCLRNDN